MVIQHNLPALNANRQLGLNSKGTASNLEKLSSGFKVNRAADDAAGLAISEKMRGQIRGLNMAIQNANNGISLIQTAEGGLNESHAILQRMRELAVQSANGTYQEEPDRYNLNKEVSALKSELDRISSATHYNGISLLNGTLGSVAAENLPGGTAYVAQYEDGSMAAFAQALSKIGFEIYSNPVNNTYINATEIAMDLFDSDFVGKQADLVITSSGGDNPNGLALKVGDQSFSGIYYDAAGDTVQTADGVDYTIPADTYAFFNDDGKLVTTVTQTVIPKLPLTGSALGGVISGIQLTGTSMELLSIGDATAPFPDGHPLANARVTVGSNALIFQIGANGTADQQVGLHVDDMSSVSLGTKVPTEYNVSGTIRDISVNPQENANDAITIIEAAINQVSATRADLGALQNRLEHSVNNLGVTAENLTAAESSIRDVDMAKEMMDFTKNNILVQASQAMLAQANQLPQGVLSLLR